MTDPRSALKSRAGSLFRPADDAKPAAVAEHEPKQDAERAKMVRLRALRLAAEAKAAVKSKGKRKVGGKGKR